MNGSVSRDEDGVVSGVLGLGVQCKAEVANQETSLDITGEIEVKVTQKKQFAGFAGRISVTAGAGFVALGVTGEVTAVPSDLTEGSEWVTTVFITPSLEWDLFLYRGSVEHQF